MIHISSHEQFRLSNIYCITMNKLSYLNCRWSKCVLSNITTCGIFVTTYHKNLLQKHVPKYNDLTSLEQDMEANIDQNKLIETPGVV
jgi:hypothetical protein